MSLKREDILWRPAATSDLCFLLKTTAEGVPCLWGHTACKMTLSEMLFVSAGPSATDVEYFPVLNIVLWMNLLNTALAATAVDCDCHIVSFWHRCIGLLLGCHSAVLVNVNLREKNQKEKTQDRNHSTMMIGGSTLCWKQGFSHIKKERFQARVSFLARVSQLWIKIQAKQSCLSSVNVSSGRTYHHFKLVNKFGLVTYSRFTGLFE